MGSWRQWPIWTFRRTPRLIQVNACKIIYGGTWLAVERGYVDLCQSCGVASRHAYGERCDLTLYNSLFRYDNQLLVNPHIFGQPASANPVLHLRRAAATGWFDRYAESFDAVWARARLWTPGQEGTPADGQD